MMGQMTIQNIHSAEFKNLFGAMTGPRPKLVGWGSGSGFYQGYPSLPLNMSYVVDPRPEKWSDTIQGLPIRGPQDLAQEDAETTIVIIFSDFVDEIDAKISSLGNFRTFRAFPPKLLIDSQFRAKTKSESEGEVLQNYLIFSKETQVSPPETTEVIKNSNLMLEELAAAPPIYRADTHWDHYAKHHISEISRHGIHNFKATINQEYFQLNAFQTNNYLFHRAVELWLNHGSSDPLTNELESPSMFPNAESAKVFLMYVGLLWETARADDRRGLLDTLEEPLLGNPVRIRRQGKLISQDVANSYREFSSVADGLDLDLSASPRIAEFGAGYGRVAWTFGQLTQARYVIFDIPPTLAVSQWYIESLFPDEKVFRFRSFDHFEEIEEELSASRFSFFTPNQISKFPNGSIDVMMGINSFHEMSLHQVTHYMDQISRITSHAVYLKSWIQGVVQHDGRAILHGDYDLPGDWSTVFDRRDLTNPKFFERLVTRA